jgi:hypothetical protein
MVIGPVFRWSKELDAVMHLARFEDFPDEHKTVNDLTDGAASLAAVGKPSVRDARGVHAEEVSVLGEDDSCLRQRLDGVFFVGSPQQIGVGRRGDINALTAKAHGERGVAVLIKMKANRSWHAAA